MSHVIQTKNCKCCGENKVRIQFGKFRKGRNKRWVNENGKQWSGLTCPDCHRQKTLAHIRAVRQKVKEEKLNPSLVTSNEESTKAS